MKDKNLIETSAFENSPADAPERRGNGVTGRRTEPGKHAHAFRMTLVSKDKLPQIKAIIACSLLHVPSAVSIPEAQMNVPSIGEWTLPGGTKQCVPVPTSRLHAKSCHFLSCHSWRRSASVCVCVCVFLMLFLFTSATLSSSACWWSLPSP